jgi:hypothetical protein
MDQSAKHKPLSLSDFPPVVMNPGPELIFSYFPKLNSEQQDQFRKLANFKKGYQ